MTKLTIIVGMPGSGKTTLGRELAHPEHQFSDVTSRGKKKDFGPGGMGELIARLARGEDCVADSAEFTVPKYRDTFRSFLNEFLPEVKLEWIFFENDRVACLNNLIRDLNSTRHRPERLNFLKIETNSYRLPDAEWGDFIVRPVYAGDSQMFSDEKSAFRFLDQKINGYRQKWWHIGKWRGRK